MLSRMADTDVQRGVSPPLCYTSKCTIRLNTSPKDLELHAPNADWRVAEPAYHITSGDSTTRYLTVVGGRFAT